MTIYSKRIYTFSMVLSLLLILVSCKQDRIKFTQRADIEIKSEVNSAFKALIEAAKSLDVEQYLKFFDVDNFTSLNADGSVFHHLTEFTKNYRNQINHIKEYQSLEFQNVKLVVVNSTVVILVNEYNAKVRLKSGELVSASGAGTQVWSKKSGAWKLLNVSSSSKN